MNKNIFDANTLLSELMHPKLSREETEEEIEARIESLYSGIKRTKSDKSIWDFNPVDLMSLMLRELQEKGKYR
jgi:hypothetical protein